MEKRSVINKISSCFSFVNLFSPIALQQSRVDGAARGALLCSGTGDKRQEGRPLCGNGLPAVI